MLVVRRLVHCYLFLIFDQTAMVQEQKYFLPHYRLASFQDASLFEVSFVYSAIVEPVVVCIVFTECRY